MFYFAIEKEGQLIKNEIRNFHRTLLLHQRLWSELNLNPLELLIELDILCEILDGKNSSPHLLLAIRWSFQVKNRQVDERCVFDMQIYHQISKIWIWMKIIEQN